MQWQHVCWAAVTAAAHLKCGSTLREWLAMHHSLCNLCYHSLELLIPCRQAACLPLPPLAIPRLVAALQQLCCLQLRR